MRKSSWLILILIVFGILIFFWWTHAILPVNSSDKSQKMFVIEKRESIREIANKLVKAGLIRDPVAFFIVIKQLGLDQKIQAGDFRLSPSQNTYQIAQNLTHGALDMWITIKEGQRADEIADILQKNFKGFNPSWRNVLNSNEGYLFPDTYLFPRDADIDLILSVMKNNFERKYNSIKPNPANKYSESDIVTIASMVEREARLEEDRPLVASVIYNRLQLGMPLQIDATVQYALGFQDDKKTWWKKDLTTNDLAIQSPYNTYTNTGLPPTPISNPGLDVLQAVVNPADTTYLYYISDKNGHNHYASTLQEHNANIKKYGL